VGISAQPKYAVPVTSRLALTIVAPWPALSYDDSVIASEGHFAAAESWVGEFGNKFRKEREKKGISLEDVSNATKISSRMLLAIEDEQFDRLPGGVFNKGFIRAYAKHIGLNEDQAVADYLVCLRQSELDSQEVWDPQAGAVPPSGAEELPELHLPRAEHVSPPRRDYPERGERIVPWRILALAILVIVLAALLWHRHSRSTRTEAAATAPMTSAGQPAPQLLNPPARTTIAAVPALHTASAPASARPSSVSAVPSAHPANPAKPPSTGEPNTSNAEDSELATQAEQTVNSSANVEPSAAAAPLNLVIRASENSWISVTADGRSVIHELLIAPAHTSIRASREIVVKIGNAAGVSFVWNGQELPAQGAEAEVQTLVFDVSGMRAVPPSLVPAQNQ